MTIISNILQRTSTNNSKIKNLKSLLWKTISAINLDIWNTAIDAMNDIDPNAFLWLEEYAHPKHWAEIFFAEHRYGHLTSNIAESLNSWLLETREKPVLPMFEQLRKELMKWYIERHIKENKTMGLLVKDIASKIMIWFSLIRLIKISCNTRARWYRILESESFVEYEIESKWTGHEYIIRFDQQTCTCR
jgi:hypothetical protein